MVDVGGGIGLERMPEYGLHAILTALRREAARRGDLEAKRAEERPSQRPSQPHADASKALRG